MIHQGSALVPNGDIPLISVSKPHMLQFIKQLQDVANNENLEMVPEKSFSIPLCVKYLGHEIGFIRIKPNQSEIAAIHKSLSPTTEGELMKLIGPMYI